jgi:hypothetical protein
MKQKIALNDKKNLENKETGKFNNIGSTDENKKKNTAAISSSVRS